MISDKTIFRVGTSFTCALALLAVSAASEAATVSLNSILNNPSFEAAVGSNCPTSWTCSVPGTVGTTSPTAADYPGANGLPSGFVPDGSVVAFAPVGGSSGVILSQTLPGQSYASGNTYTLDFWIGNPLAGTFLGSGGSVDIYLLLNGSAVANLCDSGSRVATLKVVGGGTYSDTSGACQFNLPSTPLGTYLPTDGKWMGYQLAFNVPTGLTGNVGVGFGLNFSGVGAAQGNGASMQLDIPGGTVAASPVPEPATLGLLAIGLLGFGVQRRTRKR